MRVARKVLAIVIIALSAALTAMLMPGCAPLRAQFDKTDALQVPAPVLEPVVDWIDNNSHIECTEKGQYVYVVGEYSCDTGEARGVLRVE
jgi:hypothetical protein